MGEFADRLGRTSEGLRSWPGVSGSSWPDFSRSDVVPIPLNGLAGQQIAEFRNEALGTPGSFHFQDTPLIQVVWSLDERFADRGLHLQLCIKVLYFAGIDEETPVTYKAEDVPLRKALTAMLDPLDLTYMIHREVVMITTKADTESARLPTLVGRGWEDPYVPELETRIRLGGRLVLVTSFADEPEIDSRAVGYTVPKDSAVVFVTETVANIIDIGVAAVMISLLGIATWTSRLRPRRRNRQPGQRDPRD